MCIMIITGGSNISYAHYDRLVIVLVMALDVTNDDVQCYKQSVRTRQRARLHACSLFVQQTYELKAVNM